MHFAGSKERQTRIDVTEETGGRGESSGSGRE